MFKKTEMKIFQIGKADNGGVLSDKAVIEVLAKNSFNNIPIIMYDEDKKDFSDENYSDNLIGVISKTTDIVDNDLFGEVIIFKDVELDFEFKNYEIEAIDFNKETKQIDRFRPLAIYIS